MASALETILEHRRQHERAAASTGDSFSKQIGDAVLQGMLRRFASGEFFGAAGGGEPVSLSHQIDAFSKVHGIITKDEERFLRRLKDLEAENEELRNRITKTQTDNSSGMLAALAAIMESISKSNAQMFDLILQQTNRAEERTQRLIESLQGREKNKDQDDDPLRKLGYDVIASSLNRSPADEVLRQYEIYKRFKELEQPSNPAMDPQVLIAQINAEVEKYKAEVQQRHEQFLREQADRRQERLERRMMMIAGGAAARADDDDDDDGIRPRDVGINTRITRAKKMKFHTTCPGCGSRIAFDYIPDSEYSCPSCHLLLRRAIDEDQEETDLLDASGGAKEATQ